jgi:predicted glycosyltransferase
VLSELGLDASEPIALVRTPPEVSLYHRFENDLFAQVLERLRGSQAVVLARTPEQREQLVRAGGLVIPARAIDAQSLIAFSDLVVSAGGTMNREAVALGTPVLTVFEGRLGAVDEGLIAQGRLGQLHSADQLRLVKRSGADGQRAARARRDPAILTSLLLTAARPARKGRRQIRSGRVSP